MTFHDDIDEITGLVVFRPDTSETLELKGRVAWCAAQLINAGEQGITSLERPAPRWSDYVFKLRKRGLPITTTEEKHSGTYKGDHGRYHLRTELRVIEQRYTGERVAA